MSGALETSPEVKALSGGAPVQTLKTSPMKTNRKEVLEIIDQLKTCDSIDVESVLKVCEDWLLFQVMVLHRDDFIEELLEPDARKQITQ